MSDAVGRESILRAFRKAHRDWPSFVSDSVPQAERAWFALEPEEREAAAAGVEGYLSACKRLRLRACTFAVYLREKRWEKLGDNVAQASVRRPERILAPPFGPLFGAVRAWLCLHGPVAIDMPCNLREAAIRNYEVLRRSESGGRSYLKRKGLELAADGSIIFPDDFEEADRLRRIAEAGFPEVNGLHSLARKHADAPVLARYEVLANLCEPVPVDGDVFASWLAHDERCGWPPLPDPGQMSVVWMPKGGPDGLCEFERAAAELLGAEDRGDEHAA